MLAVKGLFVGIWILNILFLVLMTHETLDYRFSKLKTVFIVMIYLVLIIPFRYWCHVQGEQSEVTFSGEIITASAFILQLICFKGGIFKRLVSFFIIEFACIITELFVVFSVNLIVGSFELYSFESTSFKMTVAMYYIAFAMITYPVIRLLRLTVKSDNDIKSSKIEWMVMLFPTAQLVFVWFVEQRTSVISGVGVIGITLGCLADILIIYIINAEHVRIKAELELSKQELIYEQEKERYENIRTIQEEIAKFRHDYQNQLLVINRLKALKDIDSTEN